MALEGFFHEVWVHADKWLTPRWAAQEHIYQIKTGINSSLRVEFQGCSSWSSCRPSHPNITGKQITPLPPFTGKCSGLQVDNQVLWRWDSQLQHCGGAVSTGTGHGHWWLCCAIPSGGQEQKGRTQLWVSRKLDICCKSALPNLSTIIMYIKGWMDIHGMSLLQRGKQRAGEQLSWAASSGREVSSFIPHLTAVLSADVL